MYLPRTVAMEHDEEKGSPSRDIRGEPNWREGNSKGAGGGEGLLKVGKIVLRCKIAELQRKRRRHRDQTERCEGGDGKPRGAGIHSHASRGPSRCPGNRSTTTRRGIGLRLRRRAGHVQLVVRIPGSNHEARGNARKICVLSETRIGLRRPPPAPRR